MSNVNELKKQLAEAEEQEKLASLEKECEQVRLEYEGKAFGSREFERAARCAFQSAIYIKKIYLGTSSTSGKFGILADIYNIRVSCIGSDYKYSKEFYEYSRRHNEEEQLFNGTNNASYIIWNMLSHLKKSITVDKFFQLWDAVVTHEIVLQAPFKQHVDNDYQNMIRQGDHTDEGRIKDGIKAMDLDIIDVQTKYPELWDKLKYCNLPMFQNNRWLPKAFGKQILQYQISLWETKLSEGWNNGHMIDSLNESIKVTTSYLKKFDV